MTDLVISDVRGDEAAHPSSRSRLAHLRGDGVSLVIDTAADQSTQSPLAAMPQVLFWGADLGGLDDLDPAEITAALSRQDAAGTLDAAWQVSLVPLEGEGWGGRPGLSASIGGIPVHPRWAHVECTPDPDGRRLSVTAEDIVNGLRLDSAVAVEAGGIVTVTHTVTRTGDDARDLAIEWLEATLPTPKAVDHLTTFAGRWTREKVPTTSTIPRGATTRQTRRGRGGHDAPTLSIVSIDRPRDRSGELWAVHLSDANSRYLQAKRDHTAHTLDLSAA